MKDKTAYQILKNLYIKNYEIVDVETGIIYFCGKFSELLDDQIVLIKHRDVYSQSFEHICAIRIDDNKVQLMV